jgi:hypothetical protein
LPATGLGRSAHAAAAATDSGKTHTQSCHQSSSSYGFSRDDDDDQPSNITSRQTNTAANRTASAPARGARALRSGALTMRLLLQHHTSIPAAGSVFAFVASVDNALWLRLHPHGGH